MGLLAVIFRKFVRELWSLIDVRITLPLNIPRHSGLLLHARHCSEAIVRFSDNSSLFYNRKFSTKTYIVGIQKNRLNETPKTCV